MSNVLLESAACGRPIITTNRSGCKEIVVDGVNGLIVKEKNSADLIDKIEKFIKLPFQQKRQMGLEGRKKVAREFDRQIVIKAYFNEIDNIILNSKIKNKRTSIN
jgi:galacturonosyltransferase